MNGTHSPVEYPWIRAWGQFLRSSRYYIDDQVALARADGAPDTAIYKSQDGSGEWATIDSITSPYSRIALGLPALPALPDAGTNDVDEHQVDEHQVDEHQVEEHQVEEHRVDVHQVDQLARRRDELAARVTGRVDKHDRTTRAAVRLVCASILLGKVGPYVQADGWLDWSGLATDLIEGLPWSGGEKRLARLACSLSDQLFYLDGDVRAAGDVAVWSLAECLNGLDDANRAAALDAVHYAATGQPLPTSTTPAASPVTPSGPSRRSDL